MADWAHRNTLNNAYTTPVPCKRPQAALALMLHSYMRFYRELCSMHGTTRLPYAQLLDILILSIIQRLDRAYVGPP
jgi:hypothetical protein